MIDKINKDIFLLKKFKRLSKKSKRTELKFLKLFQLISLPIITIISFSITLLTIELNYIALTIVSLLLISVISSLFLYKILLFINYLYNAEYLKKVPFYISYEVYYLSERIFISGKKIKKINKNIEEMTPVAHNLFERKTINQLSDEDINKLVIDLTIDTLSNEDLYSNLTYYFEEIKTLKLKYENHAYNSLMKRFLKDLNYENFNKNKKEIIKCIEDYFNEYEQQKYLKELKQIKEEFDNEIIKNNINKYKEDLLREKNTHEIKSENKILKSI